MSTPVPGPSDQEKPGIPREIIEDIFSVGHPGLSQESMEDGRRIFRWVRSNEDATIADLAGWQVYEVPSTSEGYGMLELPIGTRNASTVMAGMEAWPGEKKRIVTTITDYQAALGRLFGQTDIGVDFDTVAVTKDHEVFITPPHILSEDPLDREMWLQDVARDLNNILVDDPNGQDLVENFIAGVNPEEEAEK